MPIMIDHMGGPDYRRGTSQPAMRLILDLLANDNWWIGLSNGDLRSDRGYPWDDAVEFGRLFYQAAPDRCVWGTDWPHVHRFIRPDKDGPSDYGVEHQFARIALLERYVPDRQARDRVLVFEGSNSALGTRSDGRAAACRRSIVPKRARGEDCHA